MTPQVWYNPNKHNNTSPRRGPGFSGFGRWGPSLFSREVRSFYGLCQGNAKEKHSNNYFLKAFFLGLGLSFLVFIPFLLVDGGRFLFYGDFNVQQVPFYRLAHDAVRSGNLGWSHLTDLGANFVGSYSFYLLGSPFFWLTIPFPSEWSSISWARCSSSSLPAPR